MESTETALAPVTQRGIITRQGLDEDTEQRGLLAEYVKRHMVQDTDYGVIPGTNKPTLLKPGAEKLVDLFRCTPKFTLLKSTEDFDRGHGFFSYVFRVRLTQRASGAVLAEGFGSANSREGRYRWRMANRKCPTCAKEAIIQGKEEYGGGWLCFKKKGGCGAKFSPTDQAIIGQAQGQVENEDIASLANTILKMAKKRALVDGAIALARCSDMFTQDVEDLEAPPPEDRATPKPAAQNQPAPAQEQKKPQGQQATAEAKPIKVTDVKPGETEEQASAREAQEALRKSDDAAKGQTAKPDKAALAIRARANKIWQRARKTGMDVVSFRKWAFNLLGSNKESKDYTADDCAVLEGGLTGAEQVNGEAP